MYTGGLSVVVRALLRLAVAALILVGPAALDRARADNPVAIEFFYDDLAAQGQWVRHPYYGMVWYPASRDASWQPYVSGQWVYTEEYGWYWETDEPWGWATYHYGRWVYTAEYGWVWVPDDAWGPAWVEWRYGGGYVGWAPMPPEATWRRGTVVYVGADISAPRYQPSWVFVGEADFARGNIRARRVPPARNQAMLAATARVGNYAALNGRIVNRGVDVTQVSAAAKVRIAPALVVHGQTRPDVGMRTVGRVTIYQPSVAARADLRTSLPERDAPRFDTGDRVDVRPSLPDLGGSVGGSASGGIGIGRGAVAASSAAAFASAGRLARGRPP